MTTYQVISADSHMNTPKDIYEKYAPASIRHLMPRVESTEEGDFWVFEGGRSPAINGLATAAGSKFEDYTVKAKRFSEVVSGSWDPVARIEDQKLDGVDAEVIYGGMLLDFSKDPELRMAAYQVYNDWLADFSASAPGRLVGLAALPMWDVEMACGEARRAAKKGHRGVTIPAWSPTEQQYHEPAWEPLWSTLEELDLSVSMHLGGRTHWVQLDRLPTAYLASSKMTLAEPICVMLFGGPLVKHPGLKLVSAEGGVGWMAYLKEFSDNVYTRHRFWTQLDMPEPPSYYFDRQIFGTFEEDKAGVLLRHLIGVDNIMWASDYPHSDTTWPHSQKYIAEHFVGVPEDEKHKILAGNCARLYKLE